MTWCVRQSGFTLIELLAVTVLLALVSGLAVASLTRTGDSPVAAARLLMAIDARARLDARTDGVQVIEFVEDAGSVAVSQLNGTGRVEHEFGPAVTITTVDDRADRVVVDRLGQSDDYDAELVSRDGRAVTVRVAGLTGWADINNGDPR